MEKTQIKITVKPELAAAFKAACANAGVSMVNVLSECMAEYSQTAKNTGQPCGMTTRRQRRTAVRRILSQLETIKSAEARYMGKIPENLQNSSVYDAAEETVTALEEAVEILASAH